MYINKYNTRVRQAISDELVKCSSRKQEYKNKHTCIMARLTSEKDTLPYSEYMQLEKELQFLIKMQEVEEIKLEVWDMAREICLNVADEFKMVIF